MSKVRALSSFKFLGLKVEIPVVIHSLVNFDIVAVALEREERSHEKNWVGGVREIAL